jgi:hypothetical protein
MQPSSFLAVTIICAACGAAPPDPATPPTAGSTAGACKSVATFTSSGAPQLQKDGCTGCHAGADASATGAFDLTSLGKNDAAACAQALRFVDVTSRPQSAILQVAVGTQAHKGGTVTDPQPFTSALLGWINNE